MAVTRGRGWFRLAATDDAVTGLIHVTTIVCRNTAVAVGDFAIEDGGGTIFQALTVPADDSIPIPINTVLDGVDAGTLPATSDITVYFK